jgi:hypothetical protein
MKENPKKKSDRVLGSYQKVGTKFVPPMLQLLNIEHVSWSSQTLPELVWWDVLFDRAPRRFAGKVAEEIAGYFERKGRHEHWWAFLSDYSDLPGDCAAELKTHLAEVHLLDRLTDCLADFTELYPACPVLRILDRRPTGAVDIAYLSRFEARLRQLENKRSRNAVLAQAQVVYMAFLSGRYKVKQGLALANFPAVEQYPETEDSKTIGAAVCAAVNMFVGSSLPKYSQDAWVQYFWKRSLELRPLDFSHLWRPE